MRVLSIYFTGTGATKTFQKLVQHTCAHYAIKFVELDITSSQIQIGQLGLKNYDVFLIGGPIYYNDYPQKLVDFIKSNFSEVSSNQRIILYNTSVYTTPTHIIKHAKYLVNRGYIVSDVINVKSLNNFAFSTKHAPSINNTRQDVIDDYLEKSRLIKEILITNSMSIKINRNYNIRNLAINFKYSLRKKQIIAKQSFFNFVVSNHCDACGVCVSDCPNENIKIYNGKPVFKTSCYSCLKCIHNCPINAIEYNFQQIQQIQQISINEF